MEATLAIEVKRPQNCTQNELADFADLVLVGGEVIREGLDGRIQDAYALFFLREASSLLGIAALKNPSARYRGSVFKKACATESALHYPLELGWVFVVPSARGRRLSRRLVDAVVMHAAQRQIFATSRVDNTAMHASLIDVSFVKHGTEYVSHRGTHRIALFLRNW
jgi:GNAT superfamily N-acetyltransferase